MKLIGNIFLSALARFLLYLLGLPLLALSTFLGLLGGYGADYYRMIAITLDILGCVLGGPAWNLIFFKKKSEPEVKFGGVITMSFVFAHSHEHLNNLGLAIYNAIEALDEGHMEKAKNPSYLFQYTLFWHGNN